MKVSLRDGFEMMFWRGSARLLLEEKLSSEARLMRCAGERSALYSLPANSQHTVPSGGRKGRPYGKILVRAI